MAMLSDDVTRIELDARRKALEEYKLRCQELRAENDGLKTEKEAREMDALQVRRWGERGERGGKRRRGRWMRCR